MNWAYRPVFFNKNWGGERFFIKNILRDFKVYELTDIMRQDQSSFIQILNRIRFNRQTITDLEILNSSIETILEPDLDDQIICTTNERCQFWNQKQAEKHKNNNPGSYKMFSSFDIISHSYASGLTEDEHLELLSKIKNLPRSKTYA